jgi:hypothetical protein
MVRGVGQPADGVYQRDTRRERPDAEARARGILHNPPVGLVDHCGVIVSLNRQRRQSPRVRSERDGFCRTASPTRATRAANRWHL